MNERIRIEITEDNYHGLQLHAKHIGWADGMELWRLTYSLGENTNVNVHDIKCTRGSGAAESRAVMQEAAPYWRRQWSTKMGCQ